MKKRFIILPIISLLIILVATKPSSKDYHAYLQVEHGLNCERVSNKCIHTNLDLMSERIRSLPFFMMAKTQIFGDENNKIRVIGVFNHFFVIENKLKPQ
ncbi:hypothetical protein [Paenibacillus roseipurpureus]|uniref:Uncharacterized protein n=1 Tax=Paenibacillus roseopurpureus TaxID=2918901 RepID=A0AA96LQB8_9BACL|nr:hypothetical protein [Paenibacillus sp. MBLB1832]WNR42925.1 hypothetical protein MJB10_17605 [Paenibacillus sp. MBLB1832]